MTLIAFISCVNTSSCINPPSTPSVQHAFTYPDDREAHKQLKEIILSYKTVMFPKGEILDRNGFSVGGWCRLCALLLSDDDISPDDVKEKK